ncbi:MAG: hypothetical protein ACRECV_02040 [Xanthobacteraceae bacterium]
MSAAERQRRSRYAGHASLAEMDAAIDALERAQWPALCKQGFQPCPHCGEPVAFVGGRVQATFFQHGQRPPGDHGRIIHRVTVRHFMQRWNAKHQQKITVAEARKKLGVVPIKTPPKGRWFLKL